MVTIIGGDLGGWGWLGGVEMIEKNGVGKMEVEKPRSYVSSD